jgi:hypothetical protein
MHSVIDPAILPFGAPLVLVGPFHGLGPRLRRSALAEIPESMYHPRNASTRKAG